ncbi:MAG: SCO family protein [Nostocoides sp.]
MSRPRRAMLRGGSAIVGICLTLAACASDPTAPAAPGSEVGTRIDVPLPARLAALPLRTSTGATLTLSSLHGKVVALSDAMTLCQQTCPMDTAAVVQTARMVDAAGSGNGVVFLSLTVDPQRDDQAQLAAYRALFSPPPSNWLTLTGTVAEVDAIWDYLGVWRQKVAEPSGPSPTNWLTGAPLTYDVQHSDEVFFFGSDGHERFILEGPPHVTTGQVPRTLLGFMDAAGHSGLSAPPVTDWTSAQARDVIRWLGTPSP